jgi:hypothetical protein
MTQAKASAKRRDVGRWWIVYPSLLIQMAVVAWLGRQWEPSPNQWALVLVPSICIIFPAALMFDRPTVFKELWALGLLLQMAGVMAMAIGGVALSFDSSEPSRTMGVSFFACLFGLIWLGVFLLLFGAKRFVHATRDDRGRVQRPDQ